MYYPMKTLLFKPRNFKIQTILLVINLWSIINGRFLYPNLIKKVILFLLLILFVLLVANIVYNPHHVQFVIKIII